MSEYLVRGYVPSVGSVAIRVYAQSQSAAGNAFKAQYPNGRVYSVEKLS